MLHPETVATPGYPPPTGAFSCPARNFHRLCNRGSTRAAKTGRWASRPAGGHTPPAASASRSARRTRSLGCRHDHKPRDRRRVRRRPCWPGRCVLVVQHRQYARLPGRRSSGKAQGRRRAAVHRQRQRCTDRAVLRLLSEGCQRDQDGTFYVVSYSGSTLYGKAGGVWHKTASATRARLRWQSGSTADCALPRRQSPSPLRCATYCPTVEPTTTAATPSSVHESQVQSRPSGHAVSRIPTPINGKPFASIFVACCSAAS
jgi:hypothetical protein